MSAETVNLRFGTGERDTMPVRVYRSRGVNYVVTRSWSYPEQFAVTQRASGRAAADGLTRRQAEIIAVVLDRILPSETLGGSRLVLTHLPKPLRGWLALAQEGFEIAEAVELIAAEEEPAK